MRSNPECAGPRNHQLRGDDTGIDTHGGVAEGAPCRVGGDGEHRSLLDCTARGVGSPRVASTTGRYAATSAGAGTRQKDGSDRLRVDSTVAQLRLATEFLPAGGSSVHAAHAGAG